MSLCSYPVHVGFGLLRDPAYFQHYVQDRAIAIISDHNTAHHYYETLKNTILRAGARRVVGWCSVTGEVDKQLGTAETIWTFLLENKLQRDSLVIGLGGGVVGDLAGFCAACYMRGVPILHCPTSLLAQIDSAIGGKVAVNHSYGKNLIGAFHPPVAVVSDLVTLATLPFVERRAAMAELIKYAMIADPALLDWLECHLDDLCALEPTVLHKAVTWACEIKLRIVSADPGEHGIRAILNFGHTIGHAIESLLNYEKWRHGEAVAVGMIVAAHISYQRNNITATDLDRLITLINRANLPNKWPKELTEDGILTKIKQDKKHKQGQLRWVLLDAVGSACAGSVVTQKEVCLALAYCSMTFNDEVGIP